MSLEEVIQKMMRAERLGPVALAKRIGVPYNTLWYARKRGKGRVRVIQRLAQTFPKYAKQLAAQLSNGKEKK